MIIVHVSVHANLLRINVKIGIPYTVDPVFVDLLQNHRKESDICDVYDGEVYPSNFDFFTHNSNLSFMCNYDGAPKFKSSTMQA